MFENYLVDNLRCVSKRKIKYGAPTMEVILPTGSSAGAASVLARVSANRQNMAPNRMENVKTVRVSLPKRSLTICGIISPMNPITPQHETAVATKMEEIINTETVILRVFTPVVCAVSLPN